MLTLSNTPSTGMSSLIAIEETEQESTTFDSKSSETTLEKKPSTDPEGIDKSDLSDLNNIEFKSDDADIDNSEDDKHHNNTPNKPKPCNDNNDNDDDIKQQPQQQKLESLSNIASDMITRIDTEPITDDDKNENENDDDEAITKQTTMDGMVYKRAVTVMLTDQMRWFEDDYVKEEPLGEPGTFGMAFKCYKKTDKNKEPFAVKQINKAKFYFKEQKGILTNMKTEIKIMQILHSEKYICSLHDTYEDRNYIYLILDFLSGGELYARIEEKEELNEKEAQQITKQILSALKFMQMHKIAHLDLKPDNILFADKTPDSIIKLIDFGEAHVVEENEKLDQKIGTPYYMAPEIIRGDPYDPFPADMWSLGVIIFCMLFGFVPFLAEEEDEIYAKIKEGFKPQVMDGYGAFFPADIPISQHAMDIISGLLTSDPSLRLTVSDCLNHPWIKSNDVPTLPKTKSSVMIKQNRPQSLKKLFLVNESPIDLSSDEEEMNDFDEAYSNVPENGIIQKGYLKKEGKLFKSWKKRWFILTNNGNVSYYQSNQTLDKPLGQFSVRGNMTKLIKSTKIKNCIILCTTERNWKFVCANDKQQKEWIKALQSVGKEKTPRSKKHTLQIESDNYQYIKRRARTGSFTKQNDVETIDLKSNPSLKRNSSMIRKIDNALDQKLEDMMDELGIPNNARQRMRDMDKDAKTVMIQKHVFMKIENKKSPKTKKKSSNKNRAMTNFDLNSPKKGKKISKLKSHSKSAQSDEFKFQPINPLTKSVVTRQTSLSVTSSLMSESVAIGRIVKKDSKKIKSIFGKKHRKIINLLMKAINFENVSKNEEIIKCVNEVFDVSNDDEFEEKDTTIERIKSMNDHKLPVSPPISSSNHEEHLSFDNVGRAKTIHFGSGNVMKHKYVCSVDGMNEESFSNIIECVEFMLMNLWNMKCSQTLYAKLVKNISLTHKAKMFSVGVERKDRRYQVVKKYKDCFVGSEGVDWLIMAGFVKDSVDKRERAKDLASSFMTNKFIKHVTEEHKFKDEAQLWYTFDDALIDKRCLMQNDNQKKYVD